MEVAAIAAAVLVAIRLVSCAALWVLRGAGPAFGGEERCLRVGESIFLAYLGYLGGFSLRAQDLCFGFSFSRSGSFAGGLGARVIDLGFAAGVIPVFEPLHVSLQLIRLGAFLCHDV